MVGTASYQVLLLGASAPKYRAEFETELRRRLAELGDDIERALKLLHHGEFTAIEQTAPSVAVYFGGDTSTDEAALEAIMARSVPVLPIVDTLEDYTSKTPALLHPINGMALGDRFEDMPVAVNVVLENLSLLRRSRRLFLSYFRKESTAVAHQLRVAFDDNGYDAFLDVSSVPKADDFQSVLWHRLLDSDVMVVLDTENFITSRWTKDEIANASAMGVGILRIVWPGVARVPIAELAVHLYLEEADFVGEQLTPAAVKRIALGVEALRARCIAARHTNLVVEFCEEATLAGADVAVQPGRYVLAKLPGGRRIAAIPAVGVLDAHRYHEASARFPASGEHADEAVLIYEHRGMMPSWMGFLDWLDNYLPVRGMRVTQTATKLMDRP